MSATEAVNKERERQRRRQGPPAAISGNSTSEWLLRQIWRAANVQNEWFVFGVVGREGSGKSLTTASILHAVDPTFWTHRAHFRPGPFIDTIENEANSTGMAVMADEVGAWLGNREWYDRGQIKLNQVLQTARDDNLIIGMTLPRLEELDKQTEGRFHALLEMSQLKEGDYASFRFKYVNPSRDGSDTIYKKYPRRSLGGREVRVTKGAVGPPPQRFIDKYQAKKSEWKSQFYSEAKGELSEEDDDDDTPRWKQVSDQIVDGDPEEYITENPAGDYLDRDLIMMDFDVGESVSKRAKKDVIRRCGLDVR